MDPNSQNYWQGQQNDESLPPTQVPVSEPGQMAPQQPTMPAQDQPSQSQPIATEPTESVPSTYNGYDLTTPAAVGSAAIQSTASEYANESISWEASEYIHHQKGFLWFVAFGAITLAILAVAVYFQVWTFVALIVVMAIAFLVYALRKPRPVHYSLTADDIKIGEKSYHYSDFRAFGIIPDGGVFSVQLLPTKRFMPAITMYFEEADGEHIVDILGAHLPMEEVDHDLVDRLMRRLRF